MWVNPGIPASRLDKIIPLVTVTAKKPATRTRSATEVTGSNNSSGSDNTTAKTTTRKRAAPETETASATPPAKGMVWVNTSTKVYHMEGDRWYGKTKHGEWMTEDDAIKAGYRKAK